MNEKSCLINKYEWMPYKTKLAQTVHFCLHILLCLFSHNLGAQYVLYVLSVYRRRKIEINTSFWKHQNNNKKLHIKVIEKHSRKSGYFKCKSSMFLWVKYLLWQHWVNIKHRHKKHVLKIVRRILSHSFKLAFLFFVVNITKTMKE